MKLNELQLRNFRNYNFGNRKSFKKRRSGTDMIGMRMGDYEKIDCKNSPGSEIVFNGFFITDVAGIYKHGLFRRFYKDTFRLIDVYEMDFKFRRRGNLRFYRGKKINIKIVVDDSVFIKGGADKNDHQRKKRGKSMESFVFDMYQVIPSISFPVSVR